MERYDAASSKDRYRLMEQIACRAECRPCQPLSTHSRGRMPARPRARQCGGKAPGGSPGKNDIIQISYDMLGRLQSWYVYGGMETYAFDALGLITSNKNTTLGMFKYSYLGDTVQLAHVLLNGKPIEYAFTYEDNTSDWRLKDIAYPESARSFGYTNAPENLITSLTESGDYLERAT
jgi:hypothetical protein